MHPVVVAVTGASGAIYALQLVRVLAGHGTPLRLLASTMGRKIMETETGTTPEKLAADFSGMVTLDDDTNLAASIASGTFRTSGMVVVPASMDICGKIASGIADTLITRAAAVTMKERRRLVLVPRETPMSAIHLARLAELARAGAVVMPACPGFYTKPETIDDLTNSLVQKICDSLGIEVEVSPRWTP